MSGVERVALAVGVALAQAALVWIVSTALDFPRVWPGTVLVFGMGIVTVLVLMPRGGRR